MIDLKKASQQNAKNKTVITVIARARGNLNKSKLFNR
jgi:hypothetical protein